MNYTLTINYELKYYYYELTIDILYINYEE